MKTSKLKKQLINIVIPTIHTLLSDKDLRNDIVSVELMTNTLLRNVHNTKRKVKIYEPRKNSTSAWIKNWDDITDGIRKVLDINILPTNDAYTRLVNDERTRNSFRRFYNPRIHKNGGHLAFAKAPTIVIDDWNDIDTFHVFLDEKGNIIGAISLYGNSINNWADSVGLKESFSNNKEIASHYIEYPYEYFVSPKEIIEVLYNL